MESGLTLAILGKKKLFNVIVLKLESFISQEPQTRQSKREMQDIINFSWQSKANVELRINHNKVLIKRGE